MASRVTYRATTHCTGSHTDAGAKLTGLVLDARAGRYMPGPDSAAKEADKVKKRHHEFQRSLKAVDVRIPCARALAAAMPKGRIEVRRLFGPVLSLIEVVAYLHQHRRRRR